MSEALAGDLLVGKRALACGASRGIGRASAHAFAERGASVTVVARDREALETVHAELVGVSQRHGHAAEHHILVADFDDPDTTEERVREHLEAHGTVHILLNNSGGPPGGPILDASTDAFEAAISRHLLVGHRLVQCVVPGMKTSGYGRIVNIVSTSVRQPIPGLGVSNTTRGAVASWAKTLAFELAPFGITVNNVLPGATRTGRLESLVTSWASRRGITREEMIAELEASIPMGRFGDPREVAALAAFFASPASSYVTGTSVPVDGGRTDAI